MSDSRRATISNLASAMNVLVQQQEKTKRQRRLVDSGDLHLQPDLGIADLDIADITFAEKSALRCRHR